MTDFQRSRDLLDKLQNKQLTMKEFLYQCGMWGLEPQCWDEYILLNFPQIPNDLQEYYNMPLKDRTKVSSDFFREGIVKNYLDQKSKVFSNNWANYCHCRDIKTYIPDDTDHFIYHEKLDAKILEFEHWFINNGYDISKTKGNWNGQEKEPRESQTTF